MTNIDPTKHPNLAPLQAPCDQQRAIAVMKRYGCYVIPNGPEWELYDRDGNEFTDDDGVMFPLFPSPEAALVAAGEWLDAQGKERGK